MNEENKNLPKKDISDKELLMQECQALAAEELVSGIAKERTVAKLVKMGLEESNAEAVIRKVEADLINLEKQEKLTSLSFVNGIMGGFLGAILGAFIWGGITVLTDYEIGYVAWAIGLLCGFGTVWFSGRKKGLPLQLSAVLFSALGVIGGKYFIFYHVVKKTVIAEAGKVAAQEIELFSMNLFNYFVDHISTILSGYDVLWAVLAVFSAWKIPAAVHLKVKDSTDK